MRKAHPLLRGNPVPAVLQALASDGQLHTVASLPSRPGDSGIIRGSNARERTARVTRKGSPEGRE